MEIELACLRSPCLSGWSVNTWEDHGIWKGKQVALSFQTEMFIASLILLRKFDSHQTSGVSLRTEN